MCLLGLCFALSGDRWRAEIHGMQPRGGPHVRIPYHMRLACTLKCCSKPCAPHLSSSHHMIWCMM